MEKYSFARFALLVTLSLSASQLYAGGYMAPPIETNFDWSGFYVGAQTGYGHDKIDWNFFGGSNTERFNQSRDLAKFGAQVGYHYQWNNFVVGIETAYIGNFSNDWMTSKSVLNTDRSRRSRVNDFWLVTPRLGVANDRWLGYVKGGYANANVRFESFITSTGERTTTSSKNDSGWVVGAGIDLAVVDSLILGIEYDYISLDVENRYPTILITGFPPARVTSVDANTNLLMVRLSYKC